MVERKSTSERFEEGGVTTAPGAKMTRVTKEELAWLRNQVPVSIVLERLGVAERRRSGRREFVCPSCGGFHLALHPRENLARCFRCVKNYNPIDLVMSTSGVGFLDAVDEIRRLAGDASRRETKPGSPADEVAKLNTLW